MESDSIDGKSGEPAKEEMKVFPQSKRSARKNKASTEEKPKEHNNNKLPSALQPKFPSQKIMKKRPSRENVLDVIEITPMCPTDKMNEDDDKSLENWKEIQMEDEMMIDEMLRDEEILEQPPKETPETAHASPVDQPSVDVNVAKTKSEKPEKPEKKPDKPSSRDKNSGRSEERMKKIKKDVPSDDKKDEKKKDPMRKKVSGEDANSDEIKMKSARKSKRMHNKKSNYKPPVQKPGTQGPQQSIYQQPTLNQPTKTDHSMKLFLMEPKSYDDRGKKPKTPLQKPEAPGQPPQRAIYVKPPNVVPPPPSTAPVPIASGAPNAPECQKTQQQLIQEQQMEQQQLLLQKKQKMRFLKNVIHKTKFWGRKSDCVADPSKEMLAKSYVQPDYDNLNPFDFVPVPQQSKSIPIEEFELRLVNNHCSDKEIFVNRRPFWLTRLPTDTTPKVRIQLHRPLKQLYLGNPSAILPKWTRTEPFCDPKNDPLPMLTAIDPVIGVELADHSKKDKELNRVCANTFHATIMFEAEKLAWDEKQKKPELEMRKLTDAKKDTQKRQTKKEMAQKSSIEESNKMKNRKIYFAPVGPNPVKLYNRKHRLLAKASKNPKMRDFRDGPLIKTKITRPKSASPLPSAAPSSTPIRSSSSSTSIASSTSVTGSTTSLAEVKKIGN